MPPRYTFLYQSIHNEHFSTLVFNLCCSVSAHIRHFRREVRPVLPSTHWPQHSWPQPPTRMQPCGAAWGGKGGGPGIGGPKGRSFWMLLQPHWHDWTGTAETHWCEYISFDVKAYFGYFNSWDVLFKIWLCWTVNALNGVDSKLFLMLAWLRSIFSLTSQFHHCSLHQGWPGTGRMLVASGRIRFEEYQVHKPNQSPLFSSRPIFLSSEYYWVHLKQCSNSLLYPSACDPPPIPPTFVYLPFLPRTTFCLTNLCPPCWHVHLWPVTGQMHEASGMVLESYWHDSIDICLDN